MNRNTLQFLKALEQRIADEQSAKALLPNGGDVIDEQVQAIVDAVGARVQAVAEDFAGLLRQRIPRRKKGKSRGTADNVSVTPHGKLKAVVSVPFPWSFNEFGRLHQKANPVVRRTLLENERRYRDTIAGRT